MNRYRSLGFFLVSLAAFSSFANLNKLYESPYLIESADVSADGNTFVLATKSVKKGSYGCRLLTWPIEAVCKNDKSKYERSAIHTLDHSLRIPVFIDADGKTITTVQYQRAYLDQWKIEARHVSNGGTWLRDNHEFTHLASFKFLERDVLTKPWGDNFVCIKKDLTDDGKENKQRIVLATITRPSYVNALPYLERNTIIDDGATKFSAVAISQAGDKVAASSSQGIHIWNRKSGQSEQIINEVCNGLNQQLVFSQKDSLIACSPGVFNEKSSVMVWNFDSKTMRKIDLKVPKYSPFHFSANFARIAFSTSGNYLALAETDTSSNIRYYRVFDTKTWEQKASFEEKISQQELDAISEGYQYDLHIAEAKAVHLLAFSKDEQELMIVTVKGLHSLALY